jgi:putative ABC transport system permease protein
VELRILGLVPSHLVSEKVAFVSLELMEMTEDYRNGFSVPALSWPGREKEARFTHYPRFRLYARDLDGVGRLQDYLRAQGLEVRTRAAEIELVKRLDHAFSVVFLTLLAVVGCGVFASAASGAIDQVAKARRHLAVMSLLGLGKKHLLAFSTGQAALTGLISALLADGLFLGTAKILNFYFGPSLGQGEEVCALALWKLISAVGIVTAFMAAASASAYSSLADIEPSEGMRDV